MRVAQISRLEVADRPGDRRGLPATHDALKQAMARHLAMLASATNRTGKPIRRARGDNHRSALFRRTVEVLERRLAEPFLEQHRIAGHRISSPTDTYVHDLYQASDG